MNAALAAHDESLGVDHRALVRALDLAHFEEHSPGVVFWHPAGVRVIRALEEYSRALHAQHGYQEVRSPALLNRSLWVQSGHWAKYQDLMYVADGGELALKPMSCPAHLAIYAERRRSYRELPFRLFEFGAVHRKEASGALSGLLRLRGFVQDDAHVLVRRDGILDGVAAFVRMVEEAYPAMGFEAWSYRLALRPEQRAGSDADWDAAEGALRDACAALNLSVVEEPGGGAFYGPKLEVVLKDRLGRDWQCGVIQVDFVLPNADHFGLSYANESDRPEEPVLLHHAVFGSLERWLAIVLEHHGGLPLPLHPDPVAVCPIGADQSAAAHALVAQLRAHGVGARVVEDGPLSGRLRQLAEDQVVHWAILGAREVVQGQVMVRQRGQAQGVLHDQHAWVEAMAQALRWA